ncbi:rRNA maturation RNase YbeY [Prochlorococcus marinus]|uniref:rRNA maturation RNase YbeY n=1 Tax=Prochlorococcus marinus TaxID=1219 RepID=UPI0022B3A5F0|nr:rRNA maturation RNase YbeY [Prochlorococcus marinus]
MENDSTSSSKPDVDLSFTPFPVQDLDTFVNNETLELMKNPTKWIEDIGSWIRFIQVNAALKCPEIVLNASQFSLGLELTNDKKILDLNHTWLGQSKSTDVLSFPIIDETLFGVSNECIELGDIVISVPTAIRQAKDNNADLLKELRWLATHGLLHLLGWDHSDEESLNKMLLIQEQLLDIGGIL